MKIKKMGAFASIMLGASLLSGCVMAAPTAGPAPEQAITIAMPAEPPNTDPIMMRSIAAWNVYYATFDGLTRITAEGEIVPGLAESWTHNDDVSVWDFTIREGVNFHDGEPLKPSDIVYTFETILASETSTNKPAVSMIETVEEVEGGIVRFTLKNPFSAWLNQVATIGIVPEAVYTELGDKFVDAPVGTGPYKFVAWNRGVSYEMVRNDDYWGEKAPVKDVTVSFVGAEAARVSGVESGTLDAGAISATQVPVLQNSDRTSVISSPSNQVVFLGVNPKAGVLADQAVRKAISLAVDRETLIEDLLGGLGQLNGQLVTEGVTGFIEDFPVPEYDPKRAKELLAEAGYAGEEITLEYASTGGDPMTAEVAQAVQGFLAEVGINIRLVGTEQASMRLKTANHQITGLYLNGWAPSSMDGDVVVNQLLAGGPEDYARDATLAELYTKQQAAGAEERLVAYEEIWKLNQERAYHLPLYTNYYSYVVNPALDWTPAADGIYRATDFSVK